MKVAVVTHSSTFEERAEAVALFFEKRGDTAVRVFSDFDHHRKQTVTREAENHVYLHLRPYTRNLSLNRLLAIRRFAADAGAYLESGGFDLIYFMIPANSFAEEAERIHRKTGARVIFDLIDLWPESLPLKAVSWLSPIRRWRNLRDHHLSCADLIFTECGFYREQLDLPEGKTYTLYWCKFSENNKFKRRGGSCRTDTGVLRIAYIGAINNIIDIPRIAYLLGALNRRRKVVADIVGEGEHREDFIRALQERGVETVSRGAVYEESRKEEILSRCNLGINVMRTDVHVGLSMKSIDYLSYGIPLINSIKGDLWEFVSRYGIGVNVPDNLMTMREEELESLCRRLIDVADDAETRRKAEDLYRKNFTSEAFERTLENALEEQKLLSPNF